MREGTGSDPVGDVLRGLFRALEGPDPSGWSVGTCAAVLEALEDAVRPHQAEWLQVYPAGRTQRCQLDGAVWPCPTYRQVQDTLEGLL